MEVEQFVQELVKYVHHLGSALLDEWQNLLGHVVLKGFDLFSYKNVPGWEWEVLVLLESLGKLENHLILLLVLLLNETVKKHAAETLLKRCFVAKVNEQF